uniref:J domain-containing protein n=1 Tax=Cucumis melo TaxID=3656 RepID=A0A9I9D1F3_CUCME
LLTVKAPSFSSLLLLLLLLLRYQFASESVAVKLKMSNLRTVCRPHAMFSSFIFSSGFRSIPTVSFWNPNNKRRFSLFSHTFNSSPCFCPTQNWFRINQRRTLAMASNWANEKSPYETLELERDADDEQIKSSYRRLAKFYHPDGLLLAQIHNHFQSLNLLELCIRMPRRGTLEEGETTEARFIKIQAAYELLIDDEKRRQYDVDNRVNPMKASQAWMEWLIKKRKAFDQRGEMAIAAWAEQQQREMNLRARRLSQSKVDPFEEKRLLAKEKKASIEYFNSTLKRHVLVLKKRDIMRRKAEEEKKKVISQLLAEEGLELDTDDDDNL